MRGLAAYAAIHYCPQLLRAHLGRQPGGNGEALYLLFVWGI